MGPRRVCCWLLLLDGWSSAEAIVVVSVRPCDDYETNIMHLGVCLLLTTGRSTCVCIHTQRERERSALTNFLHSSERERGLCVMVKPGRGVIQLFGSREMQCG